MTRPVPGWEPSTPGVRVGAIEALVQQHPAIAIHFWAPWNGVDPLMDRAIQHISKRFSGRVGFFSCNVDLEGNAELCRRFGVVNIPALGILMSGHPTQLIMGYRDPETLAGEIESRLDEPKRKPWWLFQVISSRRSASRVAELDRENEPERPETRRTQGDTKIAPNELKP
ncbi:hypothetical protein BH23PLA1_BH23PLA1_04930 [soil metagenome]